MRKCQLITLFFIACHLHSNSQSVSERADSIKIFNLKGKLHALKGSSRIDSMIFLCEYYSDLTRIKTINASDSIRLYGNKILNESKSIGYKKGIAIGMLATAPDSLKKTTAEQVVRMGNETKEEEVLGWAYLVLSSIGGDQAQSEFNQLQAIAHFNKAGNVLRAAFINTWLCQYYFSSGLNEKAFDCARINLDTLKSIKSPALASVYTQSLLWSLWNMSIIFSVAGDYHEALKYLQQTDKVDRADNPKTWGYDLDISGIYSELGQYDSAMLYWNRYRNTPNWESQGWEPGRRLAYYHRARLYFMNKENEKAIQILKDNNDYFNSLIRNTKDNLDNMGNYGKMVSSILLSRIYDTLKNYKASLQYAKDGYYYAKIKNRRPEMMEACQLLSSAYHHSGNNDSAYSYLLQYVTLKDSIQSKQFLLRIYNSKKEAEVLIKESRISLLNRDNQLKQQQLKQEATFRYFLIAVFAFVIVIGLYLFRNIYLKRKNERLRQEQQENDWKLSVLENEKRHVDLQKKSVELEMQALRAQMNPHFIFNCLSSINHFILKNESKIAANYLTRFSRLIRLVLINSQKPLIALQDELEMLSLYLEMERLRFKDTFDYNISFLNVIDDDNIFIPPMLFQPFCENAIWHGIMHKDGPGRLDIELNMVDHILNCNITDNGVGRRYSREMKSKTAGKRKSMGLKITEERLALLNPEENRDTFYEIKDLYDENGNASGTKVVLKIKVKKAVEETEKFKIDA